MRNASDSAQAPRRTAPDTRFQIRSRALGDPTRLAIYQAICRREAVVSVSELVDEFSLNHNTIRQHLAKLRAADLVEDVLDEPNGPGRPRIRYRATPAAASDSEWTGNRPYERLSMLLLDVIASTSSVRDVGRSSVAHPIAATRSDHDPVESLAEVVTLQGFAPRIIDQNKRPELVLEQCPYASAALANPDVVCELHRGVLEGIAAQVGGVTVQDLVKRDPRLGNCRVKLERLTT